MIQNVVFDMGGVMIRCNFDKSLMEHVPMEADRALVRREVYGSVEWCQMDRGTLNKEDAVASLCGRTPERIHPFIRNILAAWHKSADPMPGMAALVGRLKDAGYGVYLLSNTTRDYRTFLPLVPGIDRFDGVFASADWKLLKPDPAIFRTFLAEFGLTAESCIFVDDMALNVESAIYSGFHGYVFRGDAEALETALVAEGLTF